MTIHVSMRMKKISDDSEFVDATQNNEAGDFIEDIQKKNENFLENTWDNLVEDNEDDGKKSKFLYSTRSNSGNNKPSQ